MMEWIIGVQAGLDLLLVGICFYLYRNRNNAFDVEAQAKAKAFLTVLETRVEESESRSRKVIAESERQLKQLVQICDRASVLMEQAQVPSITLSSSEEQKELLESRPRSPEALPTVTEVQKLRQQIVEESPLDFPALVNEQLA